MPATPTNSPDACESADPGWALDWVLDQIDGEGRARTLVVRVSPPVFFAEPLPAWRCVLASQGPWPSEISVFGATAVQALALALALAVDLLSGLASEGKLTDRTTGDAITVDVLRATWGQPSAGES